MPSASISRGSWRRRASPTRRSGSAARSSSPPAASGWCSACCRRSGSSGCFARPCPRTRSCRRTACARSRGATSTRRSRSRSRATRASIDYEPGESTTDLFGGNSNWRGPVWFPVNYLFIESLLRWDEALGEAFTVEYPTGSGNGCGSATWPRTCRRARLDLAPGRRRPPPGRGLDREVPRRSRVARPAAVPRVLPRRHRRRASAPRTRPAGPGSSPICCAAAAARRAGSRNWSAPTGAGEDQITTTRPGRPGPARGRRPRRPRRELDRRVDAAVADALPAPVELGLGVHGPRPLVVRRAGPSRSCDRSSGPSGLTAACRTSCSTRRSGRTRTSRGRRSGSRRSDRRRRRATSRRPASPSRRSMPGRRSRCTATRATSRARRHSSPGSTRASSRSTPTSTTAARPPARSCP